MKLTTRLTHNAIEIKVDEIETYCFKNSAEPLEIIENLLSVINDICLLTDKDFSYNINDKSESYER